MKRIITLAVAVALFSSPAFAQKRKKPTPSSKPAASAPAEPTYSYSGGSNYNDSGSGPKISALLSIGSAGGAFAVGPTGTVEWPIALESSTLMVGGQAGIWFGDITAFPILVTGRYTFQSSGSLTPYAGLAMGVTISTSSSSTVNTGFGNVTVSGGSGTSFTFLARGGVNFGEDSKLFAELPLGVIGSGFTILPSFGYRF